MPLISINRSPNSRQLIQFGVVLAIIVPLLTWWWRGSPVAIGVAVAASLLAALIAMFRPQWLKHPFIAASLITAPLGIVIGELVLLLVWFGVFLPIGLAFRMIGRDPLRLKIDPHAESFWISRSDSSEASSYYHQS